jgi:hypothetical protein
MLVGLLVCAVALHTFSLPFGRCESTSISSSSAAKILEAVGGGLEVDFAFEDG